MKVFVTGAEGFIGSHLVESLIDAGYKVTALCLYNSFSSYGWLDTLPKDIKNTITIILIAKDNIKKSLLLNIPEYITFLIK